MARTMPIQGDRLQQVKKHWPWLLAYGTVVALLGLIGLGMLVTATLVSVLAFAILLFVAGVAHLVQTFTAHGAGSKLTQFLIALLYVVTATLIMSDPVAASLSLTVILASMLFVVGILRVVGALDIRPLPGWGSLLITGLFEILLAVLIFTGWPGSGLWIIGLFISVDLLMAGLGAIALALQLRRSANRELEA